VVVRKHATVRLINDQQNVRIRKVIGIAAPRLVAGQ
jgi:hypothetical protein